MEGIEVLADTGSSKLRSHIISSATISCKGTDTSRISRQFQWINGGLYFQPWKLLMGDFKFHIDDPADTSARRFLSLIRDTGLYQHVVGPTHVSGRTLDLVFTRSSDYLITSTEVSTLMSDHNWIHVTIDQKNKSWPVKVISYRKLKNIDHEEMKDNIASSALVVETADNIHAPVEQYHDTRSSILHQLAPLITKTIRVRSNTPWFDEDIKQAISRGDVERESGGVHGWPYILSNSRSNDTVYARCLTRKGNFLPWQDRSVWSR